jgi:DNA-binding NarL/FixJ family response regulator
MLRSPTHGIDPILPAIEVILLRRQGPRTPATKSLSFVVLDCAPGSGTTAALAPPAMLKRAQLELEDPCPPRPIARIGLDGLMLEGAPPLDAPEGLSPALWNRLLEGRWSLVPLDAAEQGLYRVCENQPMHVPLRALSSTERTVLELSLAGLMGKQVALSLGVSEGHVSECLAMAAAKFGLPGRASLLRLGATILGLGPRTTHSSLSEREKAILEGLRLGLSNLEIARAGGTSERTVANQVASILRKTGAANRRQLLTRA